ncbi:MAG: flagellin [Rhodobacterales bacterium]
MALAIATNTGALMAAASASSVNRDMETSMERLSTGKRINSASDDAAGVAIASRLTSEIRGTNQAIRNAQDGQALINTAEGAHKEIENILQRMRELAVQAANDTNDSTDRTNLSAEMTQLTTEIDRIASVTTWAGQTLLDGSGGTGGNGAFAFQIGGATNAGDVLSITINAMDADTLGISAASTVDNVTDVVASAALTGGATLSLGGTDTARTLTVAGGITNGFVVPFVDNNVTTVATDDGSAEHLTIDQSDRTAVTLTLDDAAGAFAAADTIAFDIGGTSFSVALADNDGLEATTVEGAAQQVLAAIQAKIDDGTIVGMSASRAAGVITLSKDNVGETLSFDVGGTDISITLSDTDQYADDENGVAEQMKDAIQAKIDDGTLSSSLTVSRALGVVTLEKGGSVALDSNVNASASLTLIDAAIETLNSQRASLGAVSNRLDNTVSNLTNVVINLEGGRGRIEDADFAAESTSLAKSQILQQASTAMLAQANASKQSVLSLLQG